MYTHKHNQRKKSREFLQEEDDDATLLAVQTLDSLSRNYDRRMDAYEVVGISVYRELQRRRNLMTLENRLTAEIVLDIISERVLAGTRTIVEEIRRAMTEGPGAIDNEEYSVYHELGEIMFNRPPEEIKLPPTKTLEGEDSVDCSICLGPVEPAGLIFDLTCNHVFHTDCLKRWMEKKQTCPLCRATI